MLPLQLGDPLIVEWHWCAAVALFRDEVKFRCRLVTAEARHALEIHQLVSPGLDLGTLPREVQMKKFLPVCLGEGLARVLDHGLVRQELKECADRIRLVRHAILENPDRFFELLGIRVLDLGVSDFAPIHNAAERVFGHGDVCGIEAGRHGEFQGDRD